MDRILRREPTSHSGFLEPPTPQPDLSNNSGSRHPGLERKENSIHWRAPSKIFGFLVFGFVAALAHHLFAQSRHGRIVVDTHEQELYLRICTALALLTKTLLTYVVITSYMQQQWLVVRSQARSIYNLDGLFSVLHDIFMFRRARMWSKSWFLLFLASIKWLLVVPTIFTPATLSVELTRSTEMRQDSVPTIDFRTSKWAEQDHPHPIIQSTTIASAVEGDVLSITPPFTNCSYAMEFLAPALRCQAIENITVFPNPPTYSRFWNASYFSWTGEYESWNSSSEDVLRNPLAPSNARSALSVWIAAAPKVVGCVLFNASYKTTFEFKSGKQFIRMNVDRYLNRIPYIPTATWSPTDPLYLENKAYQFMMLTLGQVLVGQIGKDPLSDSQSQTYSSTLILATRLGLANATNERMLEELFANMTLSVLHSGHVQQPPGAGQKVDITISTTNNIYNYNPRWLFLSYGLGFGFTVVSAIIGCVAMKRNGASYSNRFSTIVRATRGPAFDEVVQEADRRGQDPLPTRIAEQKVVLGYKAE